MPEREVFNFRMLWDTDTECDMRADGDLEPCNAEVALGIVGVLYGIVLHIADTMSTAEKSPGAMAALLALVTEHREELFRTTAENIGSDLTPVGAVAWVDQFEATVKAWRADGTL